MFESFSIYYLYQKRLAEAICHSEIVKPNILLRKLKQRKKIKEKKVCVCVCVCVCVYVKHQCKNGRWWKDMSSPQSTFDLWNFVSNEPFLHEMHYLQIQEIHHCLKITETFE